jgi:hypothetical protein
VKTFKSFREEERLKEDGGGGAGGGAGAGGGSGASGGAGSAPGASGGPSSGCTCGTTGVNTTCAIHGSYGLGEYPLKKKKKVIGERFITRAEAMQAYYEGVRDGTIGKCPNCGSPNLSGCNRCPTAPDFDVRTCVDCGTASKDWRIKLPEDKLDEGMPPDSKSHNFLTNNGFSLHSTRKKDPKTHQFLYRHKNGTTVHTFIRPEAGEHQRVQHWVNKEWTHPSDLETRVGKAMGSVKESEGGPPPTNNAGQGNVAGIGVGPQGEPGVDPIFQRIRKQLEIVGPPPVDPRMFADKIFNHSKTQPNPKKQ